MLEEENNELKRNLEVFKRALHHQSGETRNLRNQNRKLKRDITRAIVLFVVALFVILVVQVYDLFCLLLEGISYLL